MNEPRPDLAALDATHPKIGTVIGGNYRIIEHLSDGGMGTVFVAEQVSIQRRRALKLMQPHLVSSERLRERFTQEARISSRIDSQHVVEVIDAGVDAELNVPWLAMELLEGETLGDRCERGPLTLDEVTGILGEICHAVGAAHRANIVHRDLKPENIFLAKARQAAIAHTVKVLDFGIAKLVSESALAATQAIGTPLYMPPEQMVHGGTITPAADVWSLALIAFYALTGKRYWRAGNVDEATPIMILREIGDDPIVPPSARAAELGVGHLLHPGFDAWFLGAVDRRIEARYADATALFTAWKRSLAAGAPPNALAALNRTFLAPPIDFAEDASAAEERGEDLSESPPTVPGEPAALEEEPGETRRKGKKKRKKQARAESEGAANIPIWAPPPKPSEKTFNAVLLIPVALLVIAVAVAIMKS